MNTIMLIRNYLFYNSLKDNNNNNIYFFNSIVELQFYIILERPLFSYFKLIQFRPFNLKKKFMILNNLNSTF